MTKKILLSLILVCATLLTACGSKTLGTSTTAPKQLDPQGNWLFILTDTNGNTLTWGEELFELSPPAVTSNTGVGWFGAWGSSGDFTMGVAGTVSGTATITYT
ncbi:MAG: hypothetical protein WB523_13505, partial [Candidatus Sulfotelmatobacter sp.]